MGVFIRASLLSALIILAAGCNDRSYNFSQYPGFAEWYAKNPPAPDLPTPAQRALLERYKPRVFLPDGHEGPIDFYRDYVAHGVLRDQDGEVISTSVDRDLLNAEKADPSVTFTHRPGGEPPEPRIYGRVVTETVDWPGCSQRLHLTFLTYHLVFRSSGLPAGLPGWQSLGLSLVADLDDWHQLDHYTAATLTLVPADGPNALRPIAATFQQHNYQRSYVLGERAGPGRLAMPEDRRIEIDIALRSNELYPHETGRKSRRAVSFLDLESAAYLAGEGPALRLAADDVTDPAREIDLPLAFLPPADAFYTFQGWLGERRRLPGRDGPPGADYNTIPPKKPLINQMALSWWYEGAEDWLSLYQDLRKDGRPTEIDPTPFLARIADAVELDCP